MKSLTHSQNNKPTTPTQHLSIAICQPCDVAAALFKVNLLSPFPVPDEKIEDWTLTVQRLCPETTIEELNTIIDLFATNKLHWDRNIGIQNIIYGIKHLNDIKLKSRLDLLHRLKCEALELGFPLDEYIKLYNEHNPK